MSKFFPRIAISLFLIAACSQTDDLDARKTGEPATTAAEPATPRGTLPPFNSPTRYVGVWAAAETACGHAAWRIERNKIQSPAWMACDLTNVTPSQGGFDISATCTDGATEQDAKIRLSFAESAQAMLMQGVPETGDVGLIYCGPIDAD